MAVIFAILKKGVIFYDLIFNLAGHSDTQLCSLVPRLRLETHWSPGIEHNLGNLLFLKSKQNTLCFCLIFIFLHFYFKVFFLSLSFSLYIKIEFHMYQIHPRS